MWKYITPDGIAFLKRYKYHGVDRSILAPYFQPWWRWFVELYPMWLAPNLVTLIGFSFIVLSFATSALVCGGNCSDSVPAVVPLLHFACLFIYQTMDATDGKQARRTGSSSPLGELFDHGCDAISTAMLVLIHMSNISYFGHKWLQLPTAMLMHAAFFMAQLEEYHTGTMDLGIFSVTEGQCLLMLFFSLSALFGHSFWLVPIVPVLGANAGDLVIAFSFVTLVLTVLQNIGTLSRPIKKTPEGGIPLPGSPVLHGLPLVWLLCLAFGWAALSPADVQVRHPYLFLFGMGMLNANIVSRIVLHRVCGMPYSAVQVVLVPPTAVVGLGLYLGMEYFAVWIVALYAVAAYLVFALCVIEEITKALGIKCLRIVPKKNE